MPPLDHARQERAHAANNAEDVDAEAPLPVGQAELFQGAAQHDTGVVHNDADRTNHLRLIRQPLHILVPCNITLHGQRPPTERFNLALHCCEALLVDVGDDDVGARPRECKRRGATNPASATCHDGDLA
jgi:hypothetical protein